MGAAEWSEVYEWEVISNQRVDAMVGTNGAEPATIVLISNPVTGLSAQGVAATLSISAPITSSEGMRTSRSPCLWPRFRHTTPTDRLSNGRIPVDYLGSVSLFLKMKLHSED
uniref:Uncharacterized protein n=1 Tax=Cannabis sativa TaxID=3483 RepID=A0A803Q5D3_CANSA